MQKSKKLLRASELVAQAEKDKAVLKSLGKPKPAKGRGRGRGRSRGRGHAAEKDDVSDQEGAPGAPAW